MFPSVPPPVAAALPAGLPLRIRLAVAAAVAGLAWWQFGTGPRRRPAAAWGAAFAAAGLAVGGDAASAILLSRGALPWLPTVAVGAALAVVVARGAWRGRPVTGRRRRLLAAAAVLMLVGPPLSLAGEWRALRRRVMFLLHDLVPYRPYEEYWALVADPVRSLAVAAACGCLAAAAWRRDVDEVGDDPATPAGGAAVTYAAELATYLACHLPTFAGGAALLTAAARRWRDRRAAAVLLAVAGVAVVAGVAPHAPVPLDAPPGMLLAAPLGSVAVSDSELEPLLLAVGVYPGAAPEWVRWLCFALAAACGSFAALPGPRDAPVAGPAGAPTAKGSA